MSEQQEQDELKRDKAQSNGTVAGGKDLPDGTTPTQSPLETFFALAGGARFLWGTELQDAHGKGIAELLSEDLGENDEELLKKLHIYKETTLKGFGDSDDNAYSPPK